MYIDFNDFVTNALVPFTQLFLALLLGSLMGIERTFARKTAGMRTFSLVSMGSCLFIVMSQLVIHNLNVTTVFDPLRLAAGVVTGIGFLGGGLIIFREKKLSGLTTAAGLWVSSGIGMAVGFGLYSLAISATFLTLFCFLVLWNIEHKLVKPESKNK